MTLTTKIRTQVTLTLTLLDVHDVRPDLTLQEASDVLDRLYDDMDMDRGINRNQIEVIAESVYPEGDLDIDSEEYEALCEDNYREIDTAMKSYTRGGDDV